MREPLDMPENHIEEDHEVLPEPLALESFHIVRLGDYLFDLPAFRTRARERRIDPQQFRDMLNAFPYAEKLHLTDAAQVRNAPPRAPAAAATAATTAMTAMTAATRPRRKAR